jgi:CD109 antigen
MSKEFSLLIQLNKAIFLPGDLLRFRVFSVDSETLAVNPAKLLSIYIVDPNKNVVTTFSNVTFENGKYGNSLQIASSPLLGVWSVIVENGAEVRQ